MAKKDLKINIKNSQIAQAIHLDKLKQNLAKKKADASAPKKTAPKKKPAKEKITKVVEEIQEKVEVEEAPRRKARTKSVFSEVATEKAKEEPKAEVPVEEPEAIEPDEKSIEELIATEESPPPEKEAPSPEKPPAPAPKREVLGPTGKHINDLLPPKKPIAKDKSSIKSGEAAKKSKASAVAGSDKGKKGREKPAPTTTTNSADKKGGRSPHFKEFRDVKPGRREPQAGRFDARTRHGFGDMDEGQRWRKKRNFKQSKGAFQEDLTIRPTSLDIRVPVSIKDLAGQMKLKASQLISKLFLQGIVVTINDILEDETTIQLLGHEFGCEITLDTSEEERIRITDQTIKEEIKETDPAKLTIRAPVVAFMGHVDHGKTSLIDVIRKSNITQGEAGAITQHIGAFLCKTDIGDIAILDTPGHEAFSEMRARGAEVTDIVVLVVAGDEGLRAQTVEAIEHAKSAGVSIVVAINKSDKPNFNVEDVYRQLSEQELLPEAWGGQTITVNCSAVTGEGVKTLLEMLALQAEILELKANPNTRARGSVLESELHKGMGAVATILIQNGTLKLGDALVFGEHWGRVKTMRDEFGNQLNEAPPSTPVEITGLSGLPEAGQEFITVASEKTAREIAEVRMMDKRQLHLQQTKKTSLENIFQEVADRPKKVLNIVLRSDVQGSSEALKTALLKITSDKAEIQIISSCVGEISESDVLLAAASKAIILGFHTQVEAHAEALVKQHGVHISLHDIIYHAIDDIKVLMTGLLDKVAEEVEKGKAEVKATFKASQLGKIAGCLVTEGTIHRNNHIRVRRKGEVVWKGGIASLKRVQEDVREVQKGVECGILLNNFNDAEEGDILEAYEITYISQEL